MKSKKGKKDAEESDDSDVDDLDDEEVSLGSMDEEDFGDELEEEGGMFMDTNEGGDDDEDEGRQYPRVVSRFVSSVTFTVHSSCVHFILGTNGGTSGAIVKVVVS